LRPLAFATATLIRCAQLFILESQALFRDVACDVCCFLVPSVKPPREFVKFGLQFVEPALEPRKLHVAPRHFAFQFGHFLHDPLAEQRTAPYLGVQ
jgi:hypothetical protein